MDEMTNMNDTTMENETSVEVVPEENVQMIDNEETSSNGSGFGFAVGAVGLVAAVGYGLYRKHKAKKQNKDEDGVAKVIHKFILKDNVSENADRM